MIKARESPDTVDAFIDETSFRLSGKPVLLYGTAVTAQLAAAIAAEDELRARYGLPRDLEIKWALQHQDPALKATLKQDLLARLSKHFRWLVTIRSGTDKDVAFLTSLNQLHRFAVEEGIRFLNIFHDEDTFRDRARVDKVVASWSDVRVTNLARTSSKHSVGLEYADMLAGAFAYMIQARFTGRATIARPPADGDGYFADWRVQDVIGVMLRWNSWGAHREPPADGHLTDADMIRDCAGRGVVIEGEFTADEMAQLVPLTKFWLGCTR